MDNLHYAKPVRICWRKVRQVGECSHFTWMQTNVGESFVTFRHHSGEQTLSGLLRINLYVVTMEIYSNSLGICLSDVLSELRIVSRDRVIYQGRGIVTSIVNTGATIVCEAGLDERGFRMASTQLTGSNGDASFGAFLKQWQSVYRVLPEFKVAVADMATFLADMRLWVEQTEIEMRLLPLDDKEEIARERLETIAREMTPAFDQMHEELERVSGTLDLDSRPAHQQFCRRNLHSLTMCSPFGHRTFHKPLGYAGDYGMVNMILADPLAGTSAYAKLVNYWFVSQWPATAHRNRITYLKGVLEQETLRRAAVNANARVLNLGCGPAHEVSRFLAESAASDYAEFTLMDFNDETLHHTTEQLAQAKSRHCRRTKLDFQKRSVQQLIKESMRVGRAPVQSKYDLIYCAGLFDYLNDRTCKQLMNLFYEMLEPGGLLVATNVDDCKPFRHMLEFVLDWHLIYRSAQEARAVLPDAADEHSAVIHSDSTSVNIFIEVRKPRYG